MSFAVQLESVTKSFGAHVAVSDLTLAVPSGSVYGFIGPNGSGKTTTLRMISRIYLPDRGKVVVLGETSHGPANDRIAYLPEERGLYNQMKVREVLRFYANIKNAHPTDEQIMQWLRRVELQDWADKRVQQLSKGMSQKLQFVASVIAEPELILLDEPFSGLDPVNAAVLRDLIRELRRSGKTIIFSTHDMRLAEEMCDFIFMIYKGRKVLDGTLESIRRDYGRDVLRVRLTGSTADLRSIPGVAEVNDMDQEKELRMHANADPQHILRELMPLGRIEHFEIASPSLRDIFVRIAAPEQEAIDAMA